MEGRRKSENVEEYGNISWNVEENGNNELSSRKYESLYMNLGIIIIIIFTVGDSCLKEIILKKVCIRNMITDRCKFYKSFRWNMTVACTRLWLLYICTYVW